MDTPICDFVRRYVQSNALRLHMPGHKGRTFLGPENLDITEMDGADSLYEAEGIIRQSEENASSLFGCPTFYSTEGSSQCIRAMLYLAMLWAKENGRKPLIAAARNVHRSFLSAVALLDLDVMWLYPENADSYLSCNICAETLDQLLLTAAEKLTAVYLTSPDYLGNLADIRQISEICHRHGVMLLVDNAHGAYLRFLEPSLHPIDLGADLCCDSAHKTLPVLTGGAYLHIAPCLEDKLGSQAKHALALFGSTSPSYLILQSLDRANAYLEGYRQTLSPYLLRIKELKEDLVNAGYVLLDREPTKLTISAKPYGYLGTELAHILLENNIVCEFSDPDYLVLMLTPENDETELSRLRSALLSVSRKTPVSELPPIPSRGVLSMSIREAMLSPFEVISVEKSEGRILASPSVGCPPAVPIIICGEQINSNTIKCFQYYNIHTMAVVKEHN